MSLVLWHEPSDESMAIMRANDGWIGDIRCVGVEREGDRVVLAFELRGAMEQWFSERSAAAGVDAVTLASILLHDAIQQYERERYARNVKGETELRRLLIARAYAWASASELREITQRLEDIDLDNREVIRHLDDRDPVMRTLGWDDWESLPQPPRAPRGGRPRLEDASDTTWVRVLLEAQRMKDGGKLSWGQVAAQLGISENQLLVYRHRAGLA